MLASLPSCRSRETRSRAPAPSPQKSSDERPVAGPLRQRLGLTGGGGLTLARRAGEEAGDDEGGEAKEVQGCAVRLGGRRCRRAGLGREAGCGSLALGDEVLVEQPRRLVEQRLCPRVEAGRRLLHARPEGRVRVLSGQGGEHGHLELEGARPGLVLLVQHQLAVDELLLGEERGVERGPEALGGRLHLLDREVVLLARLAAKEVRVVAERQRHRRAAQVVVREVSVLIVDVNLCRECAVLEQRVRVLAARVRLEDGALPLVVEG
mmetsp:Transcript_4738/g.15400  ORF Transcript_4738/g.15400 Transcript_4738/m.15400 type:complete len:265 (-) Transcript_4738:335-1129(-)